MISPYRIQPNYTYEWRKKASNTNFQHNSHRELEVKRLQRTANDLKTTQTNRKSNEKNKNVLENGSLRENKETNDPYLDEILDNNDL